MRVAPTLFAKGLRVREEVKIQPQTDEYVAIIYVTVYTDLLAIASTKGVCMRDTPSTKHVRTNHINSPQKKKKPGSPQTEHGPSNAGSHIRRNGIPASVSYFRKKRK